MKNGMRRTLCGLACATMLSTSGCMTTNLYCWADTRTGPVTEHLRVGVWWIFAIPALVGDVVFLPFQLAGEMHPYGYEFRPMDQEARYDTSIEARDPYGISRMAQPSPNSRK